MTISFLTPSDRPDDWWNHVPPPLIRLKKRPDYDGRHCISAAEFQRLPAHEKAGFLLAHDKGFYVHRWSPDGQRRETAHRLVEATKSPTREDLLEAAYQKHKFLFRSSLYNQPVSFPESPILEFDKQKSITPHGTPGTSTVIQFREWSDEWRIRTSVETASSSPPTQAGDRISELLSQRGAKKIAESCEYMHLKHGGFKTFVTGTFNEEIREKIKLGETSIQREVSRCMDALQKMYQRGWETEAGEKVPGHSEGLAYCWVVEIPANENGEQNPHVHMLLGWSVPYRLFAAWSQRIERIWRNGYFHLEKIKDCACAGAYMAKAAGYLSKAAGDKSQGQVRGNRYGISETARAPDWVTIGRSQLHTMGQIIADVYDHLTVKYGAQYRERRELTERLELTPKAAKWTRQKIGEKLEAVRKKLSELPVRCNKYQVILKGRTAANAFITWAKGEPLKRPDWLPELPAELSWQEGAMPMPKDSLFFTKLREKFRWLKRRRNAFTDDMCIALVEQYQEFRAEALSEWEAWSNSGLC